MKKIKYLIVFVFTFILVIPNFKAYTCKYTGDINEHKEWYNLRSLFPKGYVTLDVNEDSVKVTGGDASNIITGYLEYTSEYDKWSKVENYNEITNSSIYKKSFNGKCQSKINICYVGSIASSAAYKVVIFDDTILNNWIIFDGDGGPAWSNGKNCVWYSYSEEGSDKPSQDVKYDCDNYNALKKDLEKKYETYNDCKKNGNSVCNTSYKEYLTSKEKIKNYCNDIFSTLSANNSCSKSCLTLSTTINDLEKIDTNGGECGLSGNLIKWIKNILKWIKYILPVLVIILGIIDFIRAIASGSDDEMKKAQGRFIKRLIAAALLFIIPALIEFILNIFNIESAFCGVI